MSAPNLTGRLLAAEGDAVKIQSRPATSPAQTRQPAITAPWLSVIIVNYRQWRETAALTDQLLNASHATNGDIEVIVVDNDSPSDPLVGGLRRRPGVSLRCWKRNKGFAKAVNEGVRLSRGHWLLVLNPDVSVEADFVERVLELTKQLPSIEPRVGVVGFRLIDQDGGWQRSTGEFPTLTRTLARLVLPRARRKYNTPSNDGKSPVCWVTGCCMLLRRECVEHVDGFDEDFFLYYEDVDFCHRARAAGWGVWYEPGISVVHHHPLHGREVPAPLRVFTRHAFLTYGLKHWPRWQLRILTRLVAWEAKIRGAVASKRGNTTQADQFRRLQAIAWHIANGSSHEARKQLARMITPRKHGRQQPRRTSE
jgi:GT2 family glycosyltransferase